MPLARSGSFAHRIRREREDEYVISWRTEVKLGRLRSMSTHSRDTNTAGAMRFAKKWGCEFPGVKLR